MDTNKEKRVEKTHTHTLIQAIWEVQWPHKSRWSAKGAFFVKGVMPHNGKIFEIKLSFFFYKQDGS